MHKVTIIDVLTILKSFRLSKKERLKMGTQFSKIKVTQRVEVHGQVIHDYYAINQNGGYYQTGSDLMMESNYNHSNYSNQIMDR